MGKTALRRLIIATLIAIASSALVVRAQQGGTLSAADRQRRIDIETELESIEHQLFSAKDPRSTIETLYYVKQKLTTLKHATGPMLEYTGRLFGGRVPHVCAGLGEYFRDVYDHLIRLNQSIDSSRDTVATAIQVNLALVQISDNEVTKRLAAYAALVAIPTMIVGIYGMNFKHMPELEWTYGYPMVIALMAAIDVYLFTRFRKSGWL